MRLTGHGLLAVLLIGTSAVGLPGAALRGQSVRWQQIGTTTTGNPVFLDPRSVSTRDGIITATVRVTFLTPVDTPKGPITASRSVAMFDCAKKKVAVKENIIYHDEANGTVFERRVPQQPGFGPVFRSNFSGIALEYLCTPKPATK